MNGRATSASCRNLIERSVILSLGRVLQIAIPEVALYMAPSTSRPYADEAAERSRIVELCMSREESCGGGGGRRAFRPAAHHASVAHEEDQHRASIPLSSAV